MPASPILLLVPYRNKAAVLYSQIPTSASASGDMVVSRAGVSTRINAQGNIESVAANVPRLNYPLGGVANGCPALLVEPSAVNICLRSTWEGGGASPTGWSPFTSGGASTPIASLLGNDSVAYSFSTTASQRLFFSQTITISNATNYTFSFYVESIATGVRIDEIVLFQSGASSVVFVDPDGITISATTVISKIGRYQVRMLSTATSTTIRIGIGVSNNVAGLLVLSRPQLELGSVATSYIPTTTAAVTRNADIVTNNTFVIPNLIGAILTEFDSPTSGTYFLDNIPIPIASGSNKIAISYTPTTLTIYRNGAQVSGSPVTPPGGTAPVIGNVINIGHNNQLYQLGSGIKSFVLYSSTLSAAEASGLTT